MMSTKSRRGTIAALALAALMAAGVAAAQDGKMGEAAGPIALGTEVPLADVKMMNVDGKEVSLAEAKGAKGTLVVFTCNACPWAQAWHSRIVTLGNKAAKRGIGVVAINPNDPGVVAADGYEQMKGNAKRTKMAFPYVVDASSDVARAFGATRTPEAFLFDAEGRLVYHGTIDDNAKQPKQVKERFLEDAVNALVEGKEIAQKETKALGCSIKFRQKT